MSSKQTFKIIGILSQLEQELENSPKAKFSGPNKRVIDLDFMYDLIGDIKATLPEDIRRAHSVLAESDALIERAQEKAEEMVSEAMEKAEQTLLQAQHQAQEINEKANAEFEAKVASEPVLLEAQKRAEELLSLAEENSNTLFNGTKQYADDILADVQRYLSEYSKIIQSNREELGIRFERDTEMSTEYSEPAIQQSSEEAEEEPKERAGLFGKKKKKTERKSWRDFIFSDDEEQEEYQQPQEEQVELFDEHKKVKSSKDEKVSAEPPELDIDLDSD